MVIVFVYGSLMSGFTNHPLIGYSGEFLGTAKTLAKYTLVSLVSFPGLLPIGKDVVHGELYRVDEKTLEMLDRLEGHPCFYQRKLVDIEGHTDKLVWAYFLSPDDYGHRDVVKSGNWRTE